MKYLVFIAFFLTGGFASALPCTDFSGSYSESKVPDATVDLKITQVDCSEINISYNPFEEVQNIRLDGKKVKTFEDEALGLVSYSTPTFNMIDILINIENHWADNGAIDKLKRRVHKEYDRNRTYLLDQYGDFRSDGVFVPRSQTVYYQLPASL